MTPAAIYGVIEARCSAANRIELTLAEQMVRPSLRRFEGVNTMVVVVANRAVEMRDGAGLNLMGRISHMIGDVRMYAHRRRVQQRLEALDDRMLADIGLHRADIEAHVWGR
jgi:uncharacterized protein YjiS (DUF1127 family)